MKCNNLSSSQFLLIFFLLLLFAFSGKAYIPGFNFGDNRSLRCRPEGCLSGSVNIQYESIHSLKYSFESDCVSQFTLSVPPCVDVRDISVSCGNIVLVPKLCDAGVNIDNPISVELEGCSEREVTLTMPGAYPSLDILSIRDDTGSLCGACILMGFDCTAPPTPPTEPPQPTTIPTNSPQSIAPTSANQPTLVPTQEPPTTELCECNDDERENCDGCFCERQSVELLETGQVPRILDANIEEGLIHVLISTPLVYNRSVQISLGNSFECSYPSFDLWQYDIIDCEERYMLTAAWNSISQCSWDFTEDDEYANWCTRIIVSTLDVVGDLRDHTLSRETEHNFGICLYMEKNIEIEAQVDVTDFPVPSVEVGAQINPGQLVIAGDRATMEFAVVTSVEWPFKLESTNFLIPPIGTAEMRQDINALACEDVHIPGESCSQQWTLSIELDPQECKLDGEYTFFFDVHCQDVNHPDCSFPTGSESISATVHINSSNLCPSIELKGEVAGKMESYTDDSFTSPASTFELESTVYFQVEIVSTLEIESTTIQEIRVIRNDGGTFSLLEDGHVSAEGRKISLVHSDHPTHSTFSFRAESSVFNLPINSVEELKVECEALVETTGSDEMNHIDLSAAILIQGPIEFIEPSCGFFAVPGTWMFVITFFLVLVVAL